MRALESESLWCCFFLNFILCIINQLYSAFWWYKPRSVERIWILLIFSFLFAQSDSKCLCTYLWLDNGDMRPSFWVLGYVLLFYPFFLKSEHFSFGRTLICHTYYLFIIKLWLRTFGICRPFDQHLLIKFCGAEWPWNPTIFNIIQGMTRRRYDCTAVWWSNVYFDGLAIIRWDSGLLTGS